MKLELIENVPTVRIFVDEDDFAYIRMAMVRDPEDAGKGLWYKATMTGFARIMDSTKEEELERLYQENANKLLKESACSSKPDNSAPIH